MCEYKLKLVHRFNFSAPFTPKIAQTFIAAFISTSDCITVVVKISLLPQGSQQDPGYCI